MRKTEAEKKYSQKLSQKKYTHMKKKENEKMESYKRKAELITHTENPIETVYVLWERSKNENFHMTVSEVKSRIENDSKFGKEVIQLFRKVIAQKIPIAENINFTFMLNSDPISHREQMVRHRIGTTVGDNFGVDIIPSIEKSSFWSESMRILDYSKFVEDGKYYVPETISKNPIASKEYVETLLKIQKGYSNLIKLGIPMEDARNVLPLGTTMNISWSLNLAALMHIIGIRSCWILQYSLWSEIIGSMVREMSEKIHPIFSDLILPLCFKSGEFVECEFIHENERRVDGRDKLPVCPLYYTHSMDKKERHKYIQNTDQEQLNQLDNLVPKYSKLWNRNVWNGKKMENENE